MQLHLTTGTLDVKGDGAEVKGWGRDGEAECYIGGADSLHPVASDN